MSNLEPIFFTISLEYQTGTKGVILVDTTWHSYLTLNEWVFLNSESPSDVPGPRVGPPDVPERVPPVEGERLLRPVDGRPLHPREGDAQGEGGARAAQGDHGAAEDEARVGRQRVGRHQEVHLRSVLPPGGKENALSNYPFTGVMIYEQAVEKRTSLAIFVVVVQLIHRLTQADISCTTMARLIFFPLLAYLPSNI